MIPVIPILHSSIGLQYAKEVELDFTISSFWIYRNGPENPWGLGRAIAILLDCFYPRLFGGIDVDGGTPLEITKVTLYLVTN